MSSLTLALRLSVPPAIALCSKQIYWILRNHKLNNYCHLPLTALVNTTRISYARTVQSLDAKVTVVNCITDLLIIIIILNFQLEKKKKRCWRLAWRRRVRRHGKTRNDRLGRSSVTAVRVSVSYNSAFSASLDGIFHARRANPLRSRPHRVALLCLARLRFGLRFFLYQNLRGLRRMRMVMICASTHYSNQSITYFLGYYTVWIGSSVRTYIYFSARFSRYSYRTKSFINKRI